MASAPIDVRGSVGPTTAQLEPPSVLLKSPPLIVPAYRIDEDEGSSASELTLPTNGPSAVHDPAAESRDAAAMMTTPRKRERLMRPPERSMARVKVVKVEC